MEPNTQSPAISPSQLERPWDMFKSSWEFFKINWKLLVPIMAIPSGVMYIGQIFQITKNSGLMFIGAICLIAGLILSVAMQGGIIDAVHKLTANTGASLTWKGQYKFGFGMFWSFALLIIMQLLIMLGSAIFLLIPAIVVGVYLAMYAFARVLEGKKGFSALLESYSLIKGRWWPVFGRMLFLGLIYILASVAMGGVTFIFRSIFGFDLKSDGGTIIMLISNLFLTAVLGSTAIVYTYKLYNSLRSTRSANTIPTNNFKKWLVGFMIVGVIVLALIPFVGGAIAYKLFQEKGSVIFEKGFSVELMDRSGE